MSKPTLMRKTISDMTTVEILEAFAQDYRDMERPVIAASLQWRADILKSELQCRRDDALISHILTRINGGPPGETK